MQPFPCHYGTLLRYEVGSKSVMYEKREKPFSSCHDGSQSSPQSLMEKICEVHSSTCSIYELYLTP
jgi:hypothetical protein